MLQFYGKKGMSWPGAAICHLPTQIGVAGTLFGGFMMLYKDHILCNETNRGWQSVVVVAECIVSGLRQALSDVNIRVR